MIERYTDWVVRWRWPVIVLSLLAIAAMTAGASRLEFSNDYRVFFSEENPQLTAFETLQKTYTKNDNVLFAIEPADGNVFTESNLRMIAEVTEKAWQLPFSTRVDSITNFQHTYAEEDDLIVEDLVDPETLTAEDIPRIRAVALNEKLLLNRLITSRGDITGINVTVELPGIDPNAEVPKVAAAARVLADEIRASYPGTRVYLTGIAMMNNAFPEASQSDMQTLVPLAFLGVIVVLLLLFRSFTATFITSAVIFLTILASMGMAGWVGFPMTPPLASVPLVVLILAVADCVHILIPALHGMRDGEDKLTALRESMRINFQPVFLTSLTTAIGFMTLNFSEVPPFGHLGTTTAIGVLIAFLLAILLLPALFAVLPVRVRRGAKKQESPGMAWLAEQVIRFRTLFLWGSVAVAVVLVLFIPNNELNDNFVEYFDKSIAFRADSDHVNDNLTGVGVIDYSLDSGEEGGVANPGFLVQVKALGEWFRQQPEVHNVNVITDIFERLNKNMHGDDPAWYRLPERRDLAAQYLLLYEMSLPYGLDLNNQLNVDKSSTRLTVAVKNLTSKEYIGLDQRAMAWMAEHTPDIHTAGASPTLMFAHIGKRNIDSMLSGTVVALVLISLVLIVALRSWKFGLISLIPNLLPVAMAFGLWGMLVGRIGMASSVVAAMALGIIVDDTVHFLSKYLRARRELNLSPEDAIRYAFTRVGVALLVTSAALMAGFLILAQSVFQINWAMGALTAVAITVALVIDFLLLPPLLMIFDRDERPVSTPSPVAIPG